MKLGTFVLGGLAGAAVMMIMRNRTMSAVTDGFGQMLKQRFNNVKETAIEKGMNVKFGGGIFGGLNQGSASGGKRDSAHDRGLDKVERMASKDPHVEHDVNEILTENSQHPI